MSVKSPTSNIVEQKTIHAIRSGISWLFGVTPKARNCQSATGLAFNSRHKIPKAFIQPNPLLLEASAESAFLSMTLIRPTRFAGPADSQRTIKAMQDRKVWARKSIWGNLVAIEKDDGMVLVSDGNGMSFSKLPSKP